MFNIRKMLPWHQSYVRVCRFLTYQYRTPEIILLQSHTVARDIIEVVDTEVFHYFTGNTGFNTVGRQLPCIY